MEIDQKELLRRLDSSKNLANVLSRPCAPECPKDSTKVIPPEKKARMIQPDTNTRILAGSLSLQGVPSQEISKELSITIDQVISAKRTNNPEIAGPRDASLRRVQELALEKTMEALGLMTPDKFINANLKDLSIVAAQMSKIILNTTPKVEGDTQIQFVVYAPEQRSERGYKVIDV